MEIREEYRGKLRYLAERGYEVRRDRLLVGIALLGNEPGKLN
jgi:hypothetical protein